MEYDMDKINVIHDMVLIEVTERIISKRGSIYIPESAQKKDNPVFEGVVHKTGLECEEGLKIGEKVLFNMAKAHNFEDIFVVCPEEHILCILDN